VPYLNALEVSHDKALYKSTDTYFTYKKASPPMVMVYSPCLRFCNSNRPRT